MEAVTLSIIIVNWNVRDLLERCLQSIAASLGGVPGLSPLPYEVIVADNGSIDGSLDMLAGSFPWVQRLALGQNLGFAGANNRALTISRGCCLLLLNPDTEIVGDSLRAMLRYMDAHPDVGALGPQLHYPDGSIQSSRRRFPTYATGFVESTILQRWLPAHPLLRRYYMLDAGDEQTQDVDWLVGACLMLRRAAFEQAGRLDERYFMYSEELDYAWRLKAGGWRVVYLPEAAVIHHEGRSSGQVAARRLIMFHTAKVQYYARRFGRRRGELLRLFLLATFVLQWVEEGLKWLLGHKRPLRRQRLGAYAEVLRSRLRPEGLEPPGVRRET